MWAAARHLPASAYRCLTAPARLTTRQTARVHAQQTEQQPTRQLKLAHLNINHLMPSIDDVNVLLDTHKPDILCISETFLGDDVDSKFLIFPGYVVERCDRKSNGGGVCIIYRDTMKAETLTVPVTDSQLETLWLRFVGATIFVVGVLYRPPKSPIASTLDDLQLQMTSLLSRQHPIYALGDLNIDLLQQTSAGTQRYLALLGDLSLHQLIVAPTRTTSTSSTLIDHVITSNAELTSDARVIDCSISDHDMIAVNIQTRRTRRTAQSIRVRSTRNVDSDTLCLELLLADWSAVYSAATASEKWDAWLQVWQPVIDKHMPIRTIRLKHPSCPWLQDNAELQDCMRERDQARQVWAQDRSNAEAQQTFRHCRNAVKKAQYKACSEYFALSYRNQRSTTWTDIRRHLIASKKPEPRATPLHHSESAWAERLNRHFVSAGADVADALSAAPQGALLSPRPPRVISGAFRVQSVTLPELSSALKGMGSSRASGSDGITLEMLRKTFPTVGPHLLHVINFSIKSGEVPVGWKHASVVPLHKKGDRCDPANYRPISINSVPGKLCEKCISVQLSSYLDKNHVLCDNQHGFRGNHSTETAMIDTVNYLLSSMDRGNVSTLLAADTSRAFDSIEHERLLDKLGWYGVDVHWFEDWLKNRSQSIQGSTAGALPVTHGVIQGSLLGPKLFLMFTNDLSGHLPSGKQVTYADDVQFLDSDSVENLACLKERVEKTLDAALLWFTQNRLKINPSKTELLFVKPKQKRCDSITVKFGDANISPSSHAKILGVYVDSALSWEKQVSQVTRRCFHVLVGLSKLRHRIPFEIKKLLIEALVFPHVHYCLTVWGGCSATLRHRVQKALNFGARIVTGLSRREHVTPALEMLGWERFDNMLEGRDLAMLCKLMSPDAPPALTDLVQSRSDISARSTRGTCGGQLELPRVKTERARRAFPFRAVSAWNARKSHP